MASSSKYTVHAIECCTQEPNAKVKTPCLKMCIVRKHSLRWCCFSKCDESDARPICHSWTSPFVRCLDWNSTYFFAVQSVPLFTEQLGSGLNWTRGLFSLPDQFVISDIHWIITNQKMADSTGHKMGNWRCLGFVSRLNGICSRNVDCQGSVLCRDLRSFRSCLLWYPRCWKVKMITWLYQEKKPVLPVALNLAVYLSPVFYFLLASHVCESDKEW